MAYRFLALNGLVVMEWIGETTLEDYDRSEVEFRTAARASDRALAMLVLLPSTSAPPPPEVRKRALQAMRDAFDYVSSIHLVIRGDGMVHSLQRTAVRGMALAIGEFRSRMSVHETVRKALERIASKDPELRPDIALDTLRRQGFSV